MVQQQPPSGGGGGNNLLRNDQHVILRRNAAIGDVIAATTVADRLIDLGYSINFQAHPAMHCVLRRHPRISQISETNGFTHIDLDGAYERDPQRRMKHFHVMYFEAAQQQLTARGIDLGQPLNCTPTLKLPPNDKEAMRARLAQYDHPWVFVCPRSDSYNVRQVPDGIWTAAAAKMKGTKFWLGRFPAPPNFVDLKVQHFDTVLAYVSVADLMVSVDTGPLHVAAAFGIPMVALGQSSSPELHLSDQRDFITIEPKLQCLNCQANLCPVNQWAPPCQQFDPDFIASWVNAKLNIYDTDNVSAVVAIYQPNEGTLNHCLRDVLPQVQEVIVTAEGKSIIPPGANRDSKIRYVRKPMADIGYSRNANFGARQSTGKYLLFLNDDCFLDPHAVERMMECMKPGVGMVTNLLWYPEKQIYYNGKFRTPGLRGWGHGDYRATQPSITEPLELENACGCCALIRRDVFFQVKGFDEADGFKIYASDDDLALRIRRAGYKIMHNPKSTGIHMEGQSTRKVPDIMQVLGRANGEFTKRWSAYLDHNANKVPIGDFNY